MISRIQKFQWIVQHNGMIKQDLLGNLSSMIPVKSAGNLLTLWLVLVSLS